jgi:hypothetical protein
MLLKDQPMKAGTRTAERCAGSVVAGEVPARMRAVMGDEAGIRKKELSSATVGRS